MNTNLLDLNNDVLNIIGDYVKKDNFERIEDFNFIYYVITELLDELEYYKLSKHKFFLYNIFKGIFQPVFLTYIFFYYSFVYIFNLGVKPWSVPLQVVVGLCWGRIF
jgi:hypothetical protein